MSEVATVTLVLRKAKALERAEQRAEQVRAELHAAIRDALASGESAQLLADVLGVSRQRIYQMAKEPNGES
jgi:DNA-binding XRE family transcriptional regulator